MWDYLVKRLLPVRERRDLGDVERPHSPRDTGPVSPVDPHGQSSQHAHHAGAAHPRVLRCPVCDVEMAREVVGTVEIDRCPKCRGLFLDAGELETVSRFLTTDEEIPREKTLVYTPHGLK